MAVSKVVYGGNTLIDLTGDTVAADKLLSGYTAHDAAGNAITGTASSGGGLPAEIMAVDTPVMIAAGVYNPTGTSLENTGLSITVPLAGTYRFKWVMAGGGGSGYSVKSQLYQNGVAVGAEQTTSNATVCSLDLECAAGDVMTAYIKGYSYWGTIYGTVGNLTACIDWDNGY